MIFGDDFVTQERRECIYDLFSDLVRIYVLTNTEIGVDRTDHFLEFFVRCNICRCERIDLLSETSECFFLHVGTIRLDYCTTELYSFGVVLEVDLARMEREMKTVTEK